MYENIWLHGIEVVNGYDYYPEAHQWCLEKNLTMLGNSDIIHQPISAYDASVVKHRPMTLVFAKERSIKALREALIAGRTTVWFRNQLIGRPKYLCAIYMKAIQVGKPRHTRDNTIWFEVTNNSDINIQMKRIGQAGPGKLTLSANAVTIVKTEVDKEAKKAEFKYQVTNFLVAPDKGLPVNLTVCLE